MPELNDGPDELDRAGYPRNVITPLTPLEEVARQHRRRRWRSLLEAALALAAIIALVVVLAERADARVDWTTSTASVFDARAERLLGCWPYRGAELSDTALVVAHRSIPCGARLRLCARRCITVRVRDRGPYVAGRELDIDELAQRRIGFVYGVGPVRWRRLP